MSFLCCLFKDFLYKILPALIHNYESAHVVFTFVSGLVLEFAKVIIAAFRNTFFEVGESEKLSIFNLCQLVGCTASYFCKIITSTASLAFPAVDERL